MPVSYSCRERDKSIILLAIENDISAKVNRKGSEYRSRDVLYIEHSAERIN